MRVPQVCEVHTGAQRLPDVLLELGIAPRRFARRQLIGRDDEDGVLVRLFELLVQPGAHRGALALEELLGHVEVVVVEGMLEAELLAGDHLDLQVRPVLFAHGEVLPPPVHLVAGK